MGTGVTGECNYTVVGYNMIRVSPKRWLVIEIDRRDGKGWELDEGEMVCFNLTRAIPLGVAMEFESDLIASLKGVGKKIYGFSEATRRGIHKTF